MNRIIFCCAVLCALLSVNVRGAALDTTRETLIVPAQPEFTTLPLRVECRVKLRSVDNYNILIANETKRSATHWELFTTPGDGKLHAYLPG